jgi:hypothetical protein
LENPRTGDHLGEQSVDGRVMLRWILNKQNMILWTGIIYFRIRLIGWLLKEGNEVSGLYIPWNSITS